MKKKNQNKDSGALFSAGGTFGKSTLMEWETLMELSSDSTIREKEKKSPNLEK
ncbi:MAG: hypothetical protein AAGD88_15100 [Bacteroidota bacterium]